MDPFSDHAAIMEERESITESTLAVGRNATLTLGTDSLIVLGLSGPPLNNFTTDQLQTMAFWRDDHDVAASSLSVRPPQHHSCCIPDI